MESNKTDRGCIHLYVGDGKGKTTCAAGLALRALGCGRRVLFCQFLKGRPTGELKPLEQLGATILRAKHIEKFTFQMTPEELQEAAGRHQDCLREATRIMTEEQVDLLVLDEAVDAVNAGLFTADCLLEVLNGRPGCTEVVLTGRNPHPSIAQAADYHTDFVCVRHPYQKGLAARRGIEY